MSARLIVPLLLALCWAALAQAQEVPALARELVAVKGGYAGKKKQLEELRIRAYIPILLKAVGKAPAWKPGHPNWKETEQRIAEDWRRHYLDYLARMGRDADFHWTDGALAQEYARVFNAEELGALLEFYRAAAGSRLLTLERAFLEFYPDDMVRSLARVMLGTEVLSEREQELLRSPESRERRDFVTLFESESILHAETLRIGSRYVDAQRLLIQQGALATAADNIDALRRTLDTATLSELQAFLKSETGRKERIFISAALPAATPLPDDAERARLEEAAFYRGLEQLSAQWRRLAARPSAK